MKITYLGREIQPRKSNGQYRGNSKRYLGYILIAGAILFIGNAAFNTWYDKNSVSFIAPIASADETAGARYDVRIKVLQDGVLNDLSARCESKGVVEPDATMILDSNSQMSLGAYQWQIKSVQHYIKVLENRDISRVEAIQLAINHEKATELTRRVIFELDGLNNWINCARTHNLSARVDAIKSLMK